MKKAIYTLMHNETYFLPMWYKYYSQFFTPEDIYILSHNTSDEMKEVLSNMNCNVEYLETDTIFDHDWLLNTIQLKQRELLKKYDYVVFTDCDEFLVPLDCDLSEFIDNATEEAYRALGHDVVEDKMCLSWGFNKTLISRIPLIWCHGYHTSNPEFSVNQNLHLYHMKKLNYKELYERNIRMEKEKWDGFAVANNLSIQNHLIDKKEFDKMFHDNGPLIEHTEQLKQLLDYIQ